MLRFPTKKRSSFIILTVLFISTACLTYGGIEETITKTFDVEPGGTLTLDSRRGSIELRGHSGHAVEVEVKLEVQTGSRANARKALDNFQIEFDQRGDSVVITADYRDKSNWRRAWNDIMNRLRVKFIIEVPTQYNCDLNTSGGSIRISDLEGRVMCKTSGGSLTLEDIVGPTRARTSGGSITIGEIEGDIDVHTSGGSIKITRAAGNIAAVTSGGSITVDEVSGDLQAETSGGSIKANLTRQLRSDCKLTTSGGSITVYMGDDIGVDVNARTSGGRVHTDFPVTAQRESKKDRLEAEINGGGPELYLRTSGGSIYLRRR